MTACIESGMTALAPAFFFIISYLVLDLEGRRDCASRCLCFCLISPREDAKVGWL